MTQRGDHQYEADIRWTTHGVAHIRAGDWGGLGFGQGWACARDHLPTIADQLVKVRSERARFHGEGREGANLASDLGYLVLGVADRAPTLRAAQPGHLQQMISGYAAGYNAWVAEAHETGALPEWCAEAEWIRPIDELDLYAYVGDLGLLASGRNLAGIIGRAIAPGPDGPAEPSPLSALGGDPAGASNGWAFGSEATASGHGLVMANPHFPWGGEGRFWENHLTLPGELDCYGASLLGSPGIQIGFNTDIAWAHTFSRGHRFTLGRLDLVPGEPTRYRYGDEERAMTSVERTVAVRGDDGALTEVHRTTWSSHHGPMVNLPLLGWGLEVGYTYRDANVDNDRMLQQFLAIDQAGSMDDLQRVFTEVDGLPWVNTLAADRTGRAWYVDASATPALGPEAQQRFLDRIRDDVVAALLHASRVALLDGSDPGDDWVEHPGARSPGLLPPEALPRLERRDYVVNANDSHWLSHADVPLEGYSPLHGLERTPRTLRTRQNLRTAARLAEAGDLTVDGALAAVLGNASLSAELLVDDVVARGRAAGTVGGVDVTAAADVLAAWDRCYDLDSVGALLWREVLAGFAPADLLDAGALFAEPWDADRPVDTPAGLAPNPDPDGDADDPVAVAIAAAVTALEQAGLRADSSVGEGQYALRGAERVPVHGGGEVEGMLNVLSPVGALTTQSLEPQQPKPTPIPGRTERTGLAEGGYRCTYGTSFLMAVELTDDGPVGRGVLAYGQSGDPRSPHHRDGTDAYAAKALRPLLFTDADIAADPALVHRTVTG